MRKHIATSILACFGLSAIAMPGSQSPDSAARVLRQVEVSAAAPKSATSAAPLTTITRQKMLITGVNDVSDAIHRMPGVTLRDYGGAGGLKTVSVRGFGAGHTGVIFDGTPISDVQSGQIDLSRYSIDNVANVSMVIGDNEDIFMPARTAASAATVSISSMPVTDARECVARVSVGSFGFVNPFLRVGTPIGENFAVNVIGDFTHADNDYPFKLQNGTITTTEKRSNSRMNNWHTEVNTLWQPTSATTLTAKAYYYDNDRRLPGPVILYNDDNNESIAEQNAFAQMTVRSRLGSGLSILGIAKYNYASSHYRDVNGKYPGGLLDQHYWQREYYASASLLYQPCELWAFDYSTDYFYNDLNSNLRTNKSPRRNSILQSATAKYRARRLTVMARALCSVYINNVLTGTKAADATKLSPSLSLSYQPVASHLLYLRASYKNIFRMPTFNEAYFDHYGSTDVLPETTDQVNVGATYTTRASGCFAPATFTIDTYINHVKDMIVAVPYNMFQWRIENVGKVRIFGVDATANVAVATADRQTLTFTGNYSYQRAMPRTNPDASDWMKQVAYIPRHSGSASVAYETPWVNASVHATAVSCRYTTNNNLPATRLPGYAEWGATVWRTFTVGGVRLDCRADLLNIFNKQYYIVARYPMPGRSWRLSVTFNY